MYVLIPTRQTALLTAAQGGTGIIANILAMYPDAIVVPILNGGPVDQLLAVAQAVTSERLRPIVDNSPRKAVGALMLGYEYAVATCASDDIVVRLDSAEHDINYIGKLAEAAAEHGAVVGDLDFATGGHLREGSYDYLVHTQVFPNLYDGMTDGQLRLSCAHGFQAYRVGVLREILPMAKLLVERVEKNLGTPLTWGMDGVMAITAVSALGKIPRTLVPAIGSRNRPTETINEQLRQHNVILRAAVQMQMI